jgi:hypothetical protein
MLVAQARLPLAVPMQARGRSMRRPFHPSQGEGPYRLPNAVRDRLAAALAPYRNREAAFALATFLARFWSVPGRVAGSFPIDRCALADRPDLGLTEGRIRGAIRVLEEVGFIDRAIPPSGSRYRATEHGLRRKAILFTFGGDYAPLFLAANRRVAAARGGRSGERRPLIPSNSQRPSTALPVARPPKLPENKSEADQPVLIGKFEKIGLPASAFDPDPKLEAALARLEEGFRRGRGG